MVKFNRCSNDHDKIERRFRNTMNINNEKTDILRVLYSQQQIEARVQELADQLSSDYAGKDPLPSPGACVFPDPSKIGRASCRERV